MIVAVKLLIEPADGAAFERTFNGPSMVIGRSPTCDLPIPDPFLSRHHARIFEDRGRVFIEDLGSRNGTEVNGHLVSTPTEILPGDSIRASGSTIDIDHPSSAVSTVDLRATVLKPAVDFLRGAELDTGASDVDPTSLRTYAERLHRLNDVYKLIGTTVSLEDLTEVLLQTVLDELGPEHVSLFLLQPDETFLQTATLASDTAGNPPPPPSRRLIEEVCHRGMAALISNLAGDEIFADSQSLVLSGVHSLAAAPLLDEQGTLGMVVISSAATIREFREEDLELLTSIASVAALKIRNLRLTAAANARLRQQEEMQLARRIQESLLPQTLPSFDRLELFARNTPSRTVSGDFFQISPQRGATQCLIMIVDVSGKGVPAAILTASIDALTVAPIEEHLPPDEIFTTVSRHLYLRSPPEKYATAFLALIDLETGTLEFANAGHNPPLLIKADGNWSRLDLAGPPLGLVKDSCYQTGTVVMEEGDLLLAYTDGLTEAENAEGEQYGVQRLSHFVTTQLDSPIAEVGENLLTDIRSFAGDQSPTDDSTVIIARRLAI